MLPLSEFIASLTRALKGPLPGYKAHNKLSWFRRQPFTEELINSKGFKESAVLILIWPDKETFRCLLIRRPEYDGVHSGQMAFPGGGKEAEDKNLVHTAIRETKEETGVLISEDSVLGELSPLFIPVSNYLVYPFVACLDSQPIFNPDPVEVSALVDFDLRVILTKDSIRTKRRLMQPGITAEAPYYAIEGSEVWGATGMILSELSELLKIFIFS
ncbi:MAG: NUDIX hydrolase [Bacteroidia bacterium]